jgi:hypothetical protein
MERVHSEYGASKKRRALAALMAACLCGMLVPALAGTAAAAYPDRQATTWDDPFDSTRGVDAFHDTKVSAAERLTLSEGEPEDLGVAVPGESAVYAVLGTPLGKNSESVFAGTGKRGHLVEFDPGELYQEGRDGPPHRGVANSRGQPWGTSTDPSEAEELAILALATDGSRYIYGGTGTTGDSVGGKLVRFEPHDPLVDPEPTQRRMEVLDDEEMIGEHLVTSLAWDGSRIYLGTSEGRLLSYDGSFEDHGVCPAGAISSMAWDGALLYVGSASSDLYSFDGSDFTDEGTCPGTSGNIDCLASDSGTVFGGTSDGEAFSYDRGPPGVFTHLGVNPGATGVKGLAVIGAGLFAGTEEGKVYSVPTAGGDFTDHGFPAGAEGQPVNCLAVGADGLLYGGTGDGTTEGDGHLFRQFSFRDQDAADTLAGSAVTGITQLNRSVYIANEDGELYVQTAEDTITLAGSIPGGTPVINDVDTYQNIYVATEGGVPYRYDGNELAPIPEPDGGYPWGAEDLTEVLAHSSVRSYFGTVNGGLYRYNPASGAFDDDNVGSFAGRVYDSGVLPGADTVYVAAGDRLYSHAFDAGSSTDLEQPEEGEVPQEVRSLAVDGEAGRVYVGTEGGNVYYWDASAESWSGSLGDCGSPVVSAAPGERGALFGTDDGHVWIYDGELRDAGLVPGGAGQVGVLDAVGDYYLYGATGGGGLFSCDDAWLADEEQPVKLQDTVYRMAYDSNEDRVYAGTYRNAHFLVIDPTDDKVWDRGRPVDGEREIEGIVVASDGGVYGCTYAGTGDFHNPVGGRLFEYDPETGAFTDRGRPPDPDQHWWISSLVEGYEETDPLIYGATCSSESVAPGRFFSWNPATGVKEDLGAPVEDDEDEGEGIRCLARNDGDEKIYGGTWKIPDFSSQHLFRYEGSGSFTTWEGPGFEGSPRLGIVSLSATGDGGIFGGTYYGEVFGFDPVDEEYYLCAEPVTDPLKALEVPCTESTPCDRVWFGLEMQSGNGRVVEYAPDLDGFREVCNTEGTFGPPYADQDKVASMAFTSDNTCYGGMRSDSEDDPAHIFRMDPYAESGDAVSVDVLPGLADAGLGGPLDEHDRVGALCAAPGGVPYVYGGTANEESGIDARLFRYDGTDGSVTDLDAPLTGGFEGITALCPGSDGYIYGGTADPDEDARLFRFFAVSEEPVVQDLGVPLAGAKGIHSVTCGADGKIYVGTGLAPDDKPYLVEYTPSVGFTRSKVINKSNQQNIETLVTGPDGNIYGGTTAGSTAYFIKYNPSTGAVVARTDIEFQGESQINCMVVGADSRIYFGTGTGGSLVSYDTASGDFEKKEEGWPFPAGTPVTSLAPTGDAVYGCAGNVGNLFRFEVPGGGFTDMGPVTYDNAGAPAAATDNLDKPFFGTAASVVGTEKAGLMRYDPDVRFRWEEATYDGSVAPDPQPVVNLLSEAKELVMADIGASEDISGLTSDGHRGLRLQAEMDTESPAQSPCVDEWGLSWDFLPSIDRIYPSGAYRGDTVLIYGSNFSEEPVAVTIGGAGARVGSKADHVIQAEVPRGATGGRVTVTSAGETSNPGAFTLMEPPHVDSISPSKAHVGDVVEIKGSWFLEHRGTSYVSFNGTPAADYVSWSDGRVRARVPSGATSGKLKVYVNGHASNGVRFTVEPGGGPQVTLTAPEDGSTVSGMVELEASVHSAEPVRKVEFLVDGEVEGTDTSAPYSMPWDSGSCDDGAHTITARATDTLGRKGSGTATVYIDHTVPRLSEEWYFAEGCTDYGFETWVLIQNPASEPTVAHVTYMDEEGNDVVGAYDLAPDSRTTVNAAEWMPESSMSIEVRAGHGVICERSMYWNGKVEGHNTVGATSLSRNWYFAEGCTDYGFETYTLVGNTSDEDVGVYLRYMFEEEEPVVTEHVIAPRSRLTVDAAAEVGAGEFAVEVESTGPGVVAERAIYYGGRVLGTGTIGCRAPSTSWFLSEGSTDWGFETWLLIQNPGDGDARVDVTYRLGDGETVEKTCEVGGKKRFTVDLAGEVGVADVSTQVTSDVPVVCERAMYWNERRAGHCTVGSPGPGRTWYLAEGCTDYGFETWLLLDNPGDEGITATLSLMKDDGTVVPVEVPLDAHCRTSLNAAVYVPGENFSTRVDAPAPVMVERAMYWNAREGGTCSIGAR